MKFKLFILLITASSLLLNCNGTETDTDQEQDVQANQVMLEIALKNSSGEAISPSILQVYSARTGTGGEPIDFFTSNSNGVIEGSFEKNEPVILKITPAWHRPVELFIPSHSGDRISVSVTPSSVIQKDEISPKIIGSFNYFDKFSAAEMELNSDNIWTGSIESDHETLEYQITGFAHHFPVHGTDGELQINKELQDISTKTSADNSGYFEISFDPGRFSSDEERTKISFDENVPVSSRGVAKLFSAMQEQLLLAERFKDDKEQLNLLFNEYLEHIDRIKTEHDHNTVELAHRIAQARFLEYLNQDRRWADRLLSDLESSSELLLFHPELVHDLFIHSSRMEPVSKNLWDIYRQHRFENVQSEALFSLLNFHYDRGEDEEWYEAHFELVRSYPESKRINYSYKKGFAPEAVVHIGRYFPDLAYAPLQEHADSLRPSQKSNSLTILYFWSLNDDDFSQQFEMLESLESRFSDKGIEIIPIAMDQDRSRILRFHERKGHNWQAGLERLTNPQIQVLGITGTPHTIFLDEINRVLYHGESILKDERFLDYVEDYYN